MDSNSKRIIKNTGFLYVRMLLLMFIGIYTSRVILKHLGIEDYGIYNVVGGLTGMLAFFQSSLANATQRFLSVELGKNNKEGATNVFSQFFFIYVFFVILVLIALETFGYWFVANKLNIPPERLSSALVVFHVTVVSLCITLIGTAFNSAIIAHEDMSFYSYLGIFEGVMKLAIAYLIVIGNYDRLIMYALLLFLVVVITQSAYMVWCFRRYEECRIRWFFDKSTISSMSTFFSWNFLGTIIYMTKDQLLNILINIFFGPAINAARGISYQVNSAVLQFTNSIFTSVQPQIVKSYASGNLSFMHKLMFASSKYSVMAFWIIAFPIALNIDFLLNLWLVEVPEYTGAFTIWVLVDSTMALLTNAPWGAALATGKIRNYVLYGNGVLLLIFPIAFFVLTLGASPVSVFITIAAVRCVQILLVVIEANKQVSFGIKNFISSVMIPIIRVCSLSAIFPLLLYFSLGDDWVGFIIKGFTALASCAIFIWFLGLNVYEREQLAIYIRNKLIRH